MRLRSRTALPSVVLLVGCWVEGNEPPVVHFNGMSGKFYQPEVMGPGVKMFDYANDGDLGVCLVQGQTLGTSKALLPPPNGLPRTDRLYRNHVEGRRDGMRLQFTDVTDESGIETRGYGMGVATRDVDNDRDVDVLVGNDAGPVRLLINNLGDGNHWIGLRLVGDQTPHDMVGTRVAVVRPDGSTRWRRVRADGSYASATDPRVLVGLGESREPVQERVTWPNGHVEEWSDVPVDRYTTRTEGGGR